MYLTVLINFVMVFKGFIHFVKSFAAACAMKQFSFVIPFWLKFTLTPDPQLGTYHVKLIEVTKYKPWVKPIFDKTHTRWRERDEVKEQNLTFERYLGPNISMPFGEKLPVR